MTDMRIFQVICPTITDTLLSALLYLKDHRTNVSNGTVPTIAIVIDFNIFKHGLLQLFARLKSVIAMAKYNQSSSAYKYVTSLAHI